MEIKNAFEYIAGKVEAQLAPAGYTRQKVAADDKQEIVALFTSENVAYSVVYYKEKTHMVLRTCTMTEEGPDNEWKTLATWMLDEERLKRHRIERCREYFKRLYRGRFGRCCR